VAFGEDLARRHDDGEQVGSLAIAVHIDLFHRIAIDVYRLELGHRDEFALRKLDHVVAAIDVSNFVRSDLCNDVSGSEESVRVEHVRG